MNNELVDYDFADSTIENIKLDVDDVIVDMKLWNEQKIELRFYNCWKLINNRGINTEIGFVEKTNDSDLITQLKSKVEDLEQTTSIFQVSFFDAWDDKEVLIIIAERLEILLIEP